VTRGEAVKKIVKFGLGLGVVIVVSAALIGTMLRPVLAESAPTETKTTATATDQNPDTFKFKGTIAIAIGILVAGGSLAAAYAVASVGSAAIGAVTEKPEMMGRALIFVALAEGIAIYGLLMAFLLMGYLK